MATITQTFTKLKNEGPWGSHSGDDSSKKGPNKPSGGNGENEIEELIKFFKGLFNNIPGGNGKNSKKGGGSSNASKSLFGIVILALIALWLASGLYKVDSDENAVVLYFGKFHSVTTPGLNYRLPSPFGKAIKKSVTTVNTEEFGYRSANPKNFRSRGDSTPGSFGEESLMLTGDENIVDIDFQVQWQIGDVRSFVFNIADTNSAIRKASESAMREVIAKTPIADALSDGKRRIEQEVKILLQGILDSYGSGINITLVQMRRVDPPKQVIDSFRDVQTAKADKERLINQAQAHRNGIIPKARGEAAQLTEAAEAYKKEVIANAEGQASRFLAVHKQYTRAKVVTKKRIYLETMEKIYKDMDKIIIDKAVSKSGMVPYLPINEINKKK